ncbi:MAG: group II intron reverse transcriptase/maturase [Verrucomicrobiota bacterium]
MCATSAKATRWDQINWVQCERQVRRLQARIVKATREGRWGKVKTLQRLLTCSFSATLAVKRVTENQGKRTPGVDGVCWNTPAARLKAIGALHRRGYRPLPLRRVHIPKANGKQRPLGIPTMKDRAMQALYLLALEPIAETTGDPNSYGFRRERSTADALFNTLCRDRSAAWILEGDITGCFDHISHDWMLRQVPTDQQVLRKWLKAGYVENRNRFPTEAGTPQGGIISPTLANLTLDGLEPLLAQHFPKEKWRAGKVWRPKVNLVRYADDFIITGDSRELLEQEVRPLVEQFLKDRGLTLSLDKTRITHTSEGFDFLGQNLRKYDGKPLVKPSKKNVQAFLEKVRGIIHQNKAIGQTVLIGLLNPVLRGWVNYHRHCAAKATFNRVDHEIWRALWQWARRRHPKKSRDWVKQHCFPAQRNRAWTFATKTGQQTPDGQPSWTRLVYAGETKIRRHVKLRQDANPFDPQWKAYFTDQTFQKKFGIHRQQAGIKSVVKPAPPPGAL